MNRLPTQPLKLDGTLRRVKLINVVIPNRVHAADPGQAAGSLAPGSAANTSLICRQRATYPNMGQIDSICI